MRRSYRSRYCSVLIVADSCRTRARPVASGRNEVQYVEYRNGTDLGNHVRKIAATNTTEDVVLKRRLIGPQALRLAQSHSQGQARPAHCDDRPARRGSCSGLRVRSLRGPAEEVARPSPCSEERR
jgi:hypothetical protein